MGRVPRGHLQAVPASAITRRDPCSRPEALPSRCRSLGPAFPSRGGRTAPRGPGMWSSGVRLGQPAPSPAIVIAVCSARKPRTRGCLAVAYLLTVIIDQHDKHGRHGAMEAAELSAIPVVFRLSRNPTLRKINRTERPNCPALALGKYRRRSSRSATRGVGSASRSVEDERNKLHCPESG